MPSIASIFSSPPEIRGIQYQQPGAGERTGISTELSALPQQQSLIQRLLALSQGVGPSLAQTLLQQQTAQNVAAGAGAAASTRGISPALAARLARLTQGSAVQQAAGSAATARANEQLGALSGVGGAIAGLGNLAGDIYRSASGVRQRENEQRINENLGLTGARQQQFQSQQQLGGQILGGIVNGAGALASKSGLGGPSAAGGAGGAGEEGLMAPALMARGGVASAGRAALAQRVVHQYLSRGGSSEGEHDMRAGGTVPGRAKHPDRDTEANDTFPAMLTPGEGVVPLTKMQDPEEAAEFARQMASERDEPRRRFLEQRRRRKHRRPERLN